MIVKALPEQFAGLEEFVELWALPTERERKEKRASSTLEELLLFGAAVGPRVPEIGTYLDQFPMQELEPPQLRLLQLALIYMDVALALEFYRKPEPSGVFPRQRFVIRDLPRPENPRRVASPARPSA